MTQSPPRGAPDGTPPAGAPASWPPPGGPPPGQPAPPGGYGPVPPGAPGTGTPPWGPPIHQPGVVPLRPLTLGDIFGGAIATVRRNPKATVGLAALVTFVFMLIPTAGTVVLGAGGNLPALDATASDSGAVGDGGLLVSSVVSAVFSALASIVVTGLIVRVVEQALVGQQIGAGETWRRSRGRLLPLIGFTLLVGIGLVLVLAVPVGLGVVIGVLV